MGSVTRRARSVRLDAIASHGVVALIAVACFAMFSVPTALADTPAPLAWGNTGLNLEQPPAAFGGKASCPSPDLCMAPQSTGIAVSTDPSRGWRVTSGVDTTGSISLTAMSCPSAMLCVAVDLNGNVLTSSDPTGPASTWHAKLGVFPSGLGIAGIDCPSTTLCVGITQDGWIVSSADPADGATATWGKVATNETLYGVSCGSTSMCVAVGQSVGTPNDGVIYASASPTSTILTDWKLTSTSAPVNGVSCPSAALCVAYENGGSTSASVTTSTGPTAATPVWTAPATIDASHAVTSLSCGSITLCVALDNGGNAVTSANPTGSGAAWTSRPLAPFGGTGSSMSCTASGFCVAELPAAPLGQIWTTFDPTQGWTQANTSIPLYASSCPSTTLCVAVDDVGNILTTANASANPPSWTVTPAAVTTLLSVSCPTVALCVATDGSGDVVTSTSPTGGAGAWSTLNVEGTEPILAVSCPTTTFCVAVNDIGDVLTSTNPAAGPWTVTDIDGSASLNAVTCPTTNFCAAVDDAGNVLTSTNPAGGAGAWTSRAIDGSNRLLAISCVTTVLCVAGDDAGNALTSTAPASATPGWSAALIDNAPINAVSCPSTVMCAAVDSAGYELNAINPAGGAGEWTYTLISSSASVWGISCPSTAGCLAVDGAGHAPWGAPTPSNLTPPTIAGTAVQGGTLTEGRGRWTDSPTSYQVQWERCDAADAHCTDIANATAQQYVPAAADLGSTIRVLELASNANGDGAVGESAQTAVVAAAPNPVAPGNNPVVPGNTAAPRVSGTAEVGVKLTCSQGNWSGSAPLTYSYQWLRNGTAIPGAVNPTYTTTTDDASRQISCTVKAANSAGAATAASAAVKIAPLPPCYDLAGTALAKCRALQRERTAVAKCSTISTKTVNGHKRRAQCIAKAKRTYKQAVARIGCNRIKNAHKRAVCLTAARKL
jgi:hypothetical protein